MDEYSELEHKIRARLLVCPLGSNWANAYKLLRAKLGPNVDLPVPLILAASIAHDLIKSEQFIEQLNVAEANGLKRYFLSVLNKVPENRWVLGPPPPLPPTKAERRAAILERQVAERERIYASYSQAVQSGDTALAAVLPDAIKAGRLSDVANIVDQLNDLTGVTNMVGKLSSYAKMHSQNEVAEYLKSRGL